MKTWLSNTKNGIKTNGVYFESPLESSERNDCVVRSMTVGFNTDYDSMHAFCTGFFNRKKGEGTYDTAGKLEKHRYLFDQQITRLGKEREGQEWRGRLLGKDYHIGGGQKRFRNMSVGTFLKTYTEGTYLVIVNRHMFTVIDGEVYGNSNDGRQIKKPIQSVFKIGRLTKEEKELDRANRK